MLRTAHLLLRPFEESDVDPLYEIQGNREHMRFTYRAESRAACDDWLRRYASSRATNGFAPWTAVHLLDERVVGWGGLNVDPHAPGWGPEVTYFMHRDCAGRGYATELVRAALRHGFVEQGLDAIGAFTRPANLGSIRVLEKCGFSMLRYEPALERNHYEVRREDWTNGD